MFPIKTYKKMEIDPLDSLINTLAKLKESEGAAIQILVKSAPKSWRARAQRIVREVRKGKILSEAMKSSGYSRIFGGTHKAAEILLQKEKQPETDHQRMTQTEEETLKAIEEKMSKAGLEVNIRIIVSATNDGQAQIYLDNIIDSFNQYIIFEYGNGFKRLGALRSRNIVSDFIFRKMK